MSTRIAAVIVTLNAANDIAACLESLKAQTSPPGEVVLVDNASSDTTVAAASSAWPGIRLIRNERNEGFCRPNNLGIAATSSEYVLLLNSDATLDPGYLEALMRKLDADPSIGSATGKVLRPDGSTIDTAGIVLNRHRLAPGDRGEGETDRGQFDTEETVFGASAAAAVYRRKALASVAAGGQIFDEEFFITYEDVDLAWRLRRAGWSCLYVPSAVAKHARKGPTAVSRANEVHAFKNRYLLYWKNASWGELLCDLPVLLPWEAGRCLGRAALRPWVLRAIPKAARVILTRRADTSSRSGRRESP